MKIYQKIDEGIDYKHFGILELRKMGFETVWSSGQYIRLARLLV